MSCTEDEVHIWRIALDCPCDLPDLRRRLSADEQQRAERYRFVRDRRRATVRRAALREILAQCLSVSPADVTFAYGPQGKPRLDGPLARQGWHFNLSFSDELALCAVGRQPLGIDVERHRRVENAGLVAKHFFTPGEVTLQEAAADADRVFLEHWTRKEALIKATGSGLSVPLASFDVSAPSQASPWQVTLPDADGRPTTWWLCDLNVNDGWIAALASASRVERQHWLDWKYTNY